MGAACGWCVGFGFRSLVVSSSVRDPRCWFLVCWCCFGCVGSACPACVALCCSALPCVRFVCSGRDELIVPYMCTLRTSLVPEAYRYGLPSTKKPYTAPTSTTGKLSTIDHGCGVGSRLVHGVLVWRDQYILLTSRHYTVYTYTG